MKRTGITVKADTLAAINAARVDLYSDAGQVLNQDGLLLFLLGVWRQVRYTEEGIAACRVTSENMILAKAGRDRRCHT